MKIKVSPSRCAFLIIDAQKGFTDSQGTFGVSYGIEELKEIWSALRNLQRCLQSLPQATHTVFVRSEYKKGQFTGGSLHHPLAYLCTPSHYDSEWADGIVPREDSCIITKNSTNVFDSENYRGCIQDLLDRGVQHLIFGGFTLTTCVQQAAVQTFLSFGSNHNLTVSLALDITGSRMSRYNRNHKRNLVTVEQTLLFLQQQGIEILDTCSKIEWD